jgi:type II secretory pathway pseudopilin PulG
VLLVVVLLVVVLLVVVLQNTSGRQPRNR